jgi:DnaK suppressor protein
MMPARGFEEAQASFNSTFTGLARLGSGHQRALLRAGLANANWFRWAIVLVHRFDIPLSVQIPEELTPPQTEELHVDLVELRTTLAEAIRVDEAASKPVFLDQSSVGRLSRMDAMQVQAMAKASLESHKLRHKQVAQALRLIEAGDYGLCRRCDEPIGFCRLKARPETPLCLRCQGASEAR